MKIKSVLFVLLLSLSLLQGKEPSKDDAVKLVQSTVELMKKNATAVIQRINQKDPEFLIKELDDLYVLVFDDELNVLAHPIKPQIIGKSWKGKKDTAGVCFGDSIQAKALSAGKGWQEYIFTKPSEDGLQFAQKTTYFELVSESGKKYIVGAGVYAP